MKILLTISSCLIIFPWLSIASVDKPKGSSFKGGLLAESVSREQATPDPKDPKSKKAIEDYEKEKLARYKRNIGKRFLAVRTVRPPEFYESPNDLKKKIKIKEKEEFQVMEVVQNESGTMNFYKVRLEGGEIGYLGADGNNLEIRIKDGSIMTVTKKLGKKKPPKPDQSRAKAPKAIEMVKNHLIPSDPVSKDKRSIERRMREARATSHPKLKWRYQGRAIGGNKYRVTQYAEGESDRVIVRTWIVDLSTRKVSPENQAAKDLYRR